MPAFLPATLPAVQQAVVKLAAPGARLWAHACSNHVPDVCIASMLRLHCSADALLPPSCPASPARARQALAELESLQRLAPGEPSVAFQMGKLYKRLGNLTVRVRPARSGSVRYCDWLVVRGVPVDSTAPHGGAAGGGGGGRRRAGDGLCAGAMHRTTLYCMWQLYLLLPPPLTRPCRTVGGPRTSPAVP